MRIKEVKWEKLLVVFALLIGVLSINAALPAPADANDTSNVYRPFGCTDKCKRSGVSELDRANDSVSVHINTKHLDHNPNGTTYTVWWVIFNDPDNCVDGCDGADIDACAPECDDEGISVLWATGSVIPANGKGEFQADLAEGIPSGQVLFGQGLTDAEGAEIHMVIRTHGPPIPGLVDEQITLFGGGCDVEHEGDLPVGVGYPCEDQQFAIHQP
ncbi:MAG: hypothetical protein OES12_01055 [Anaerolineae bacterium]|nr:hypothetical protein [Anaerolineae bacterium]